MALRQWLGQRTEQQAERHLHQQGLTTIEKNYRCTHGEIDLIMRDGEYCVFVEVRYRKNDHFGGAAASVDARKQGKLIRSAEHYLQTRGQSAARFDVITVNGKGELNWIQHAFEGQAR